MGERQLKRKVLFYNLFVRIGKKKEAYKSNLISLISYIHDKALNDRIKIVNEYEFKIHEVYEEDDEIYTITFSKKRNDKPYTEEEEKLKELDDDIYETTTIIYNPSVHLIMIDYIHNGPSARTFMQYLNSFLKDDSDIEVCIRQVKTADQIAMIRNSNYIKEINIEYDITDDDYVAMFNGDFQDKALMVETARKNSEVSKRFDSKIANLILKKGRFKDPVNKGAALTLFEHLNTDSSIIRGIKVTVRKGFSDETYDLKHNKKAYGFVDIQVTNYLSIKNKLVKDFNEKFCKDTKLNLKDEYKRIKNRSSESISKDDWESNYI